MAHPFRSAVEAQDHAAMVACLAPDVLLHSPVAHRPFVGRDAAAALFGALLVTFEDFVYIEEMTGPDRTSLLFRARVGDRGLEGVDLLHDGPDGLIDHFTMLIRPLSALTALAEALAAHVGALPKGGP